MRTTLDIDDALYHEAARRYPAGTPKTVIVEEGLRSLISRRPIGEARALGFFAADGPVVLYETWNDPIPGFEELP